MIDAVKMKRLALIKYIFTMGLSQSYLPEPLFSTAILTFHDAVELFLQLTCEELNIHEPKITFTEYWSKINLALNGTELPQKSSMARLNSSRINFKHHGNIPSKLDIEGFRASVTYFFEESCKQIFGIDFSDISLIEVVINKRVKDKLYEAMSFMKKNEFINALDQIAIAFKMLVHDFERENCTNTGKSIFDIGTEFHLREDIASRTIARIIGNIESLQDIVEILSLGIDTKKYLKFKSLTPHVSIYTNDVYHVQPSYGRVEPSLNQDDAQFSLNFVIESAVKLQEFYL